VTELPNKGNKYQNYRDNCIEADCEKVGMMWPGTEHYWDDCPNCGGWGNPCMRGGCVPKPTPSPTPAPTYEDFLSDYVSYRVVHTKRTNFKDLIQKERQNKKGFE